MTHHFVIQNMSEDNNLLTIYALNALTEVITQPTINVEQNAETKKWVGTLHFYSDEPIEKIQSILGTNENTKGAQFFIFNINQ